MWSSCGSTYCTCFACCYSYTAHVRPSVLQPSQAHSRCNLIINRCHSYSELVGVVKMPFVSSHVEYCDMHFVYGFCDGNAHAAVDEYRRHFPDQKIPSRVYFLVFTRRRVRLIVFQVFLCSLNRRWYQWVTHKITFWRWFREVHNCTLIKLPLASAYHVCRSSEVYMRKINILIMFIGYNIWNQATLLNLWICSTG